jgi:hypothetical protein
VIVGKEENALLTSLILKKLGGSFVHRVTPVRENKSRKEDEERTT